MINNGGRVYPQTVSEYDGIFLRDHIALEVLKSFIIAGVNASIRDKVRSAYEIADMMIKERGH